MRMCDGGHAAEIDHMQQRIGWRLYKDQLGARSDLLFTLLWSTSIDVVHNNAVAVDHLGK